ncbi:MAG: alpha/beta fold hydrolase [Planctomycetota bacterium]
MARPSVVILLLATLPLSAQASGFLQIVRAKRVPHPTRYSFQPRRPGPNLTPATEKVLRQRQSERAWKQAPLTVLNHLEREWLGTGNADLGACVAELWGTYGFENRKSDPVGSTRAFFKAATIGHDLLCLQPDSQPSTGGNAPEPVTLYNESLAAVIRQGRSQMVMADSGYWTLPETEVAVRVQFDPRVLTELDWSNIEVAADYKSEGLQREFESGVGVPLVATLIRPENPEGIRKYMPPRSTAPLTAVLLRDEQSKQEFCWTLDLIDPLRLKEVELGGYSRRMAKDLTTPLAFLVETNPIHKLKIGLLNAGETPDTALLFMFEPYQRGKIPVVFIHGLYSSAGSFGDTYNILRAHPFLREHYQFWFFQYPTGNPFLYSTYRLRDSLETAREDLDPDHSDPAFDRLILVGHSMGGILSKMQIQRSGEHFWNMFSERPFEELQAEPKEKELLREIFFFEPQHSVRRVVFVATPHRGSKLAGNAVGKIGSRMAKLSGELTQLRQDLVTQNANGFFDPEFYKAKRPPTSIEELAPHSQILEVLNQLPLEPSVPIHSIIGNLRRGPPEKWTDGIVPYASAHLPNAETECVIRASHSCESHPETIREIHRILLEHLDQTPWLPAAETPGKNLK